MLTYERQAKRKGYRIIIGCDEAGRGPLAGPVVVAAVCLKKWSFDARVDDSKKLTVLQRQRAFAEISKHAVFDIGILNEGAIDSINIACAVTHAADVAIAKLLKRLRSRRPTRVNTILLCDGRLKPTLPYESREIIGGDGKSLSIAAASVIAKVVRDRIMVLYDSVYPGYGFGVHKGYGTEAHTRLIRARGLSPIHRRTFCHPPEAGRAGSRRPRRAHGQD